MRSTNLSQTNTQKPGRDAAIQITCNSGITCELIDGVTYYTAIRRGVEYTAYKTSGGDWWVSSHRLALGRHIGGGKYYADLEAVAAGCKAFAGLAVLLNITTASRASN